MDIVNGEASRKRGTAAVEFALLLPLLLTLLIGVLEMGRLWTQYNVLQFAAREGARKAAVTQDLVLDDRRVQARVNEVLEKGGIEPTSFWLREYSGGRGFEARYDETQISAGDQISIRVGARFEPVVAAFFSTSGRPGWDLQAEVISVYER